MPQKQTFTNVTPIQSTPQTFSNVAPIDGSTEEKSGLLSRADSAITSALEPNPENYRGAFRTNAIEVPKTLGREVYSGVKTIAGLADPRPYYHALTDAPKEDEPPTFGNPVDPSGIATRAAYRLIGKPVQNAVEDYSGGKVSPDAALSVAPEAMGTGAGTVVAGKLAQMVPAGKIASSMVRGAGKTYNVARTVGAAVAPVAGVAEGAVQLAHGNPAGALYSAMGGGMLGRVVKALPEAPEAITEFGRPKLVDPGAPLPEAPDPALLQARSLFEGSSSPPDPAAGLETIPVRPGQAGSIAESMKSAPSAEVAPGFQRGSLQSLLDKSLGAKKLEPNVPLRQQMDRVTPSSSAAPKAPAAAPDLPEGHAPVQSSALKSYKYDPQAQEFHARYSSGGDTTHVFGDVSPEEAQAFAEAKSKGSAMQTIKNGHALVAKIINGKRVAVKAGVTQ